MCIRDSCSTDGSKTIAEQYSSTYPFCKLLSHKQNKGLAGSRNSGVKKAEGEWLFFVDSDDWIHADTDVYKRQVLDPEMKLLLRRIRILLVAV